MQTNKKIKLSPIKQLIDLNGEKVNFDLNFEVKTIDNSPFEALVVTQSILDSGEEIKYKNVSEGIITGNIVADKGIYDNYFILLRAKKEVDCEVNINIKDINQNLENQKRVVLPIQNKNQNQNQLEMNKKNQNMQQIENQPQNKISKKNNKINWKLIITIFILILGSFLLWYFYKNSSKSFFAKNIVNTDVNIKSLKDNLSTRISENISDTPANIDNLLNESLSNNLQNSTIGLAENLNIEVPKVLPTSLTVPEIPSLEVVPNVNSKLLSKINNIPIW